MAYVTDDRPEVIALLAAIKRDHDKLSEVLKSVSSNWVGEDLVYRFWHQSNKVFYIQDATLQLVDALRALAPDRQLNPWFETIVDQGTGRKFDLEDNKRWLEVARPMLEAFFHARFMVELAVKYGRELEDPPAWLPSGWVGSAPLSLWPSLTSGVG